MSTWIFCTGKARPTLILYLKDYVDIYRWTTLLNVMSTQNAVTFWGLNRHRSYPVVRMWRKWLNNITEVSSENQHHLVSRLRPLLRLLAIFGIDLDLSQPYSTHRRYGFVILSLLVYGGVIMFNSVENSISSDRPASTRYWIDFIVLRTWFIWNYSFPTVMNYMATFYWKNLWLAIENLERSMNYPTTSLRQLHRVSIGLTALAIGLVNRALFGYLLFKKWNQISVTFHRHSP